MDEKVIIAKALGIYEELDLAKIRDEYEAFAERMRPMVCDTSLLLNEAIRDGKRVLFEGAQGTMLDIDHGTYPFVTSSSASAGGACTGTGVPPTRIDGVIGVSKAYITRVGGGPFPTEALDGAGDHIRERGKEFGAVTGRPRRCGWFDVPLLALHGRDQRLRQHRGDQARRARRVREDPGLRRHTGSPARKSCDMPPTVRGDREARTGLRVRARLEYVHLRDLDSYDALPAKAKDYIAFLESRMGVEIGCISTGPERNQTIVRSRSKFARLTGAR